MEHEIRALADGCVVELCCPVTWWAKVMLFDFGAANVRFSGAKNHQTPKNLRPGGRCRLGAAC